MDLHHPDFVLISDDATLVDIGLPERAAYWATLLEAEIPEISYAVARVGNAAKAVEMAIASTRDLGRSAHGAH